ncbi:MAG: family 43 glycosylhydrolase [Clostridia bacterium]|nr:family 43 glycosylhydrolase [Clostridia bacterium]
MNIKKRLMTFIAVLLCGALIFSASGVIAAAYETADTGVRVRDPFVLEYDGVRYMYGTGLAWDGYGCVYSTDLENWSEPVKVYEPQGACDGEGDWWAPECHYYNGSFYLFATYRSAATGKRGVGIFRSSTPLGPFEIITDSHITPKESDSIDGTLYVDDDGQPWMVYVGEWTSAEDGIGTMMAAKLSDDLTSFVSEPVLLFRAKDGDRGNGFVTDGPFLYKTKGGRLIMLWSNFRDNSGYCVLVASSSNGKIDGKWRQQPGALYKASDEHMDGGHAMLFTADNGTLLMSIHSPNMETDENQTTARFVPVVDTGDTLIMEENSSIFTLVFYRIYYFFLRFADIFQI